MSISQGASTHTGNFTYQSGASLQLTSGTYNFSSSSFIEGSGLPGLVITGGTYNFYGSLLNPESFSITSGSLVFWSPVFFNTTLTLSSASSIVFNSKSTIRSLRLTSTSTSNNVQINDEVCVQNLLLSGGSYLNIRSPGKLNVATSFEYSGTSTAYITGTAGGSLNLLPNCTTIFNGSNANQYIAYINGKNLTTSFKINKKLNKKLNKKIN